MKQKGGIIQLVDAEQNAIYCYDMFMYLKKHLQLLFFSTQLGEPQFPSQVLNPCHLQWEHIFLTISPQGKFFTASSFKVNDTNW